MQPVKIFGILNLTPDSFSDGGRFANVAAAVERAETLRAAGADVIDVGGESTRPGATPVAPATEIARVQPVLQALKKRGFTVSLDTCHAATAAACLPDFDWFNDVTGLADPAMRQLVARTGRPAIGMHSTHVPVRPESVPTYADVTSAVLAWWRTRVGECTAAGIARTQLVLDPGLGFGKSLADNLRLLREIGQLTATGFPVCLGASRKSFIGKLDGSDAAHRLGGSVAAAVLAVTSGVSILRVHDVAETAQAVRVARAVRASDFPRD